jgi:hypothetical protein
MHIPSGHSVRLVPRSWISIRLILLALCNRNVSKPRTIAGGASLGVIWGRPRKSCPVADPVGVVGTSRIKSAWQDPMADGLSANHSPLKNVMGSVRRIVNGPLDLPTMTGDLAGSVFHLERTVVFVIYARAPL